MQFWIQGVSDQNGQLRLQSVGEHPTLFRILLTHWLTTKSKGKFDIAQKNTDFDHYYPPGPCTIDELNWFLVFIKKKNSCDRQKPQLAILKTGAIWILTQKIIWFKHQLTKTKRLIYILFIHQCTLDNHIYRRELFGFHWIMVYFRSLVKFVG